MDVIEINDENYGTTLHQAIYDQLELAFRKANEGSSFVDMDDLDEVMLSSDVDIEKAEAAILKHLDETVNISETINLDVTVEDQILMQMRLLGMKPIKFKKKKQ